MGSCSSLTQVSTRITMPNQCDGTDERTTNNSEVMYELATIEKAEFRNWVKLSLSLRHTKDGLADVADKKANSLREDIEKAVEARCKAAVQNTCTKCTNEFVKKAKRGKGVHYYMSCTICNHWITVIQNFAEANHKLEWSNCDPQKWPQRSWEIVKVFMGYGCSDSRNVNDIDCSNLMTMMMGCTYFHDLFADINILREIKNIRNGVMHSGSLEVSDNDMKRHLSKMVQLLENSSYLQQDISCKEAVEKINQLKDNTLTITVSKEDAQRELTCLITELQKKVGDLKKKNEKITEDVQHLSDSQASFLISHEELKTETENNLTLIEANHKTCTKLIDSIKMLEMPDINIKLQILTDELKSLNNDTQHDIQRLNEKFKSMDLRQNKTEQTIKGLTSQQDLTEQNVKGITLRQDLTEHKLEGLTSQQDLTEESLGLVQSDVQRLQQSIPMKAVMKTDKERKHELQQHLIRLYENEHSSMSVYPLKPHLTRKLDDMYVKPEMVEKNPRGQTKPQPNLADLLERIIGDSVQKVRTLENVFFKDFKICKNIYVIGEAGIGKSAFCKYIVRMWLKAHSNTPVDIFSDAEFMKRFPLLFYVQLRGVKLGTEPGELAKLIKKQLNLNDGLENFYSDDSSLIISDSLDEIASGLPCRDVLDKSTRLTTSRPWKLAASWRDIYGNRIDRQIEIVCIGETSAERLVQNLLPVLAKESANEESTNVSERDSQSFITEMKNKNLVPFLRIPALLIQTLCLWYDDNLAEEESQSSIHKKLLCYQIRLSQISRQISQDRYELCESLNCPCNNFSDIVVKLGHLALNALISENCQNELVFDQNITEMHGLSEQDVNICLKIGCLSKHKLFGKITDDPKVYVSFVHKTNQEYFASIYLAHEVSNLNSVFEPAIDNLDKMLELEKVLIFVCGLNPENGLEMATLLQKAAERDYRVLNYRQTAGSGSPFDDLISNVQNTILAAMMECWRSNKRQLNLPLMDIVVNNKNMSRVSSHVSRSSYIASVRIQGNMPYIPADNLVSLIDTSRLQKVVLYMCIISGTTVTQLTPSSLCALYLGCVRMSHADLSDLCSQLAAAENLMEVTLFLLECETHGRLDAGHCGELSLDLGRHNKLCKLTIGYCDVSSLVLSPHMNKLRHVTLGGVKTRATIVRKIVDCLQKNAEVTMHDVIIRHEEGAQLPNAILDSIRQSYEVKIDACWLMDNGDMGVKQFNFTSKLGIFASGPVEV